VRREINGVQRALIFGVITMSGAILSGFIAIATQI